MNTVPRTSATPRHASRPGPQYCLPERDRQAWNLSGVPGHSYKPNARELTPANAVALNMQYSSRSRLLVGAREARRSQACAASHRPTSNCLSARKNETSLPQPPPPHGQGLNSSFNRPPTCSLDPEDPFSPNKNRPLRSMVRVSRSCFAAQKHPRRCFVSVETRLLLRSPQRSLNPSWMNKFLGGMTARYNREFGIEYPQMECLPAAMGGERLQVADGGKKWMLMHDASRGGRGDGLGIHLRSSNFEIAEDPSWSDKIKVVWQFLYKYYDITDDPGSHTYIHAAVVRKSQEYPGDGHYTVELADIRKIAQCALHFEPAILALVPTARHRELDAMSNWIDNDNFLETGASRRQAINLLNGCASIASLIRLVCPNTSLWPWPDRVCFAWNFRSLHRDQTVEFRSCGANLGWETASAWMEFVSCFVQAAVRVEASESLEKIPANVGALKEFLGGAVKVGELGALMEGRKDRQSREPQILRFQGTTSEGKLQLRLDQDELLQRKLQAGS